MQHPNAWLQMVCSAHAYIQPKKICPRMLAEGWLCASKCISVQFVLFLWVAWFALLHLNTKIICWLTPLLYAQQKMKPRTQCWIIHILTTLVHQRYSMLPECCWISESVTQWWHMVIGQWQALCNSWQQRHVPMATTCATKFILLFFVGTKKRKWADCIYIVNLRTKVSYALLQRGSRQQNKKRGKAC